MPRSTPSRMIVRQRLRTSQCVLKTLCKIDRESQSTCFSSSSAATATQTLVSGSARSISSMTLLSLCQARTRRAMLSDRVCVRRFESIAFQPSKRIRLLSQYSLTASTGKACRSQANVAPWYPHKPAISTSQPECMRFLLISVASPEAWFVILDSSRFIQVDQQLKDVTPRNQRMR